MPTPSLADDLKALPEHVNKLRQCNYDDPNVAHLIYDPDFEAISTIATRLSAVGKDLEIIAALQSEVAELHQYLSEFPMVTGSGRLKARVQRLIKYFAARGKK